MNVTVTAHVIKRCPYVDEIDIGTIALTFADKAPELHDLAARLGQYQEVPATHEDFTRDVMADTGAIRARSTWTTAGLAVVVEEER